MNKTTNQKREAGGDCSKKFSAVTVLGSSSLEKPKRARTKKLGAFNTTNRATATTCLCKKESEMSADMSRRGPKKELLSLHQHQHQHQQRQSKRLNVPKKIVFDECYVADHATIPRKLRSAMKRSRESTSSSCGMGSTKRDNLKKSKPNLKNGRSARPSKESVGGTITKDEEEVVEMLFALAGMFPNNEANKKSKDEDTSPSISPEARESRTLELQEGELNTDGPGRTDQPVNPTSDVEMTDEIIKVDSLNQPNFNKPHDSPSKKWCYGQLGAVDASVNLHSMSADSEEKKPLSNPINFHNPPDPCESTSELKQPIKMGIPLVDWEPEITLRLSTATGSENCQEHECDDSTRNGPVSWPGLCRSDSSGPSESAKNPDRPYTTLSVERMHLYQNGSTVEQVSKPSPDNGSSWKRCMAHVLISRLITASKTPDRQDCKLFWASNQPKLQLSEQHMPMEINGSNGVRRWPKRITSIGKKSHEVQSRLLPQRLQQDQPNLKQNYDFFSLSAGGSRLEASGGAGSGLSLKQMQLPYLSADMQNQNLKIIPFTIPQSHQAQLQFPYNNGRPFRGSQTNFDGLTKQQQQHRMLWTTQQPPGYMTFGTALTPSTHIPISQNERNDLTRLMQGVPQHHQLHQHFSNVASSFATHKVENAR